MTDAPAFRFLHVCYCCNDVDLAANFFVDALGMRLTMRTPLESSDGELLGMDRIITSAAAFVYDRRGPRTSPAIEVQQWADPEATGVPSLDPFEVGIKSLGFSVPDLDDAQALLEAHGCTLGACGVGPTGAESRMMIDPTGTPIELLADADLVAPATQMHHLRITVTTIDDSMPFYSALGFETITRNKFTDARFAGVTFGVVAEVIRLRLSDEPFEVQLVQWHTPSGHGRHYAEPNHSGVYRAALGVGDTVASYDRLTAAGMTFDRHPRLVELKGTPVPDMWITFISDPDGIPYEFVQRPRDVFRA